MEYETLVEFQGWAKFFMILFVFIVFYSYAFSIYRREKKGDRDFEKYSKLVLDDAIDSEPLEKKEKEEDKDKKLDKES
jgi:cytochrome c oxidase cbb3-type subunit 4